MEWHFFLLNSTTICDEGSVVTEVGELLKLLHVGTDDISTFFNGHTLFSSTEFISDRDKTN